MEEIKSNFRSKTGELSYTIDWENNLVRTSFGDLRKAGLAELLESTGRTGDAMKFAKTGKLFLDICNMANFDIPLRITIPKNLQMLMLDKVPYLVVGVLKSKSLFENMTMQLAMSTTVPLFKKILAAKMFDTEKEAIEWLIQYEIPPKLKFN